MHRMSDLHLAQIQIQCPTFSIWEENCQNSTALRFPQPSHRMSHGGLNAAPTSQTADDQAQEASRATGI